MDRCTNYPKDQLTLHKKIKLCYQNILLCNHHPTGATSPRADLTQDDRCAYSALRGLNQLGVLLRVRLLDIALCHLLHHEVAVNLDILDELAVGDAPLAGDGQHADGRLCVDEAVDACGSVGESELVGCLGGVSLDARREGGRERGRGNAPGRWASCRLRCRSLRWRRRLSRTRS